jgi:phenylacetate-CoA ligase
MGEASLIGFIGPLGRLDVRLLSLSEFAFAVNLRRPTGRREEVAIPESVEALEDLQSAKLRRQVGRLADSNPFYARLWAEAGVDTDGITSTSDIRSLPFISKADLLKDQKAAPPFGDRLHIERCDVHEITLTSGTSGQGKEVHAHSLSDAVLRGELTAVGWEWAGLRSGDIAVPHVVANNAASLWCMVRGIRAVGRLPYLVGHMGFDERIDVMRTYGVHAMFAMPSALTAMATRCDELGVDPLTAFPDLRIILTSGESWPVEWVQRMESFWHARLTEVYGSTQTNAAFGACCCERGAVIDGDRGHNHLFEWTTLYEILEPDTDTPVSPGEPGELIVTHLDKEASPLIRFRTGDLVRWFPAGSCPCGRPLRSIEAGTVGRIDDMLKIRGQNIWPSAVDPIVLAHPEVDEFQVRVHIDRRGRDVLDLELALRTDTANERERVVSELSDELRFATGLRFDIALVSADDVPHYDSPDRKPRRWRDERHIGLAGSTEP